MEFAVIYFLPIIAIVLAGIGWIIADRLSSDKTEIEINRDKKRIDNITDRINNCSDGIRECEAATERIAESEQRIDSKISVASKSVTGAKQNGSRIEQLADECLSILEEGEKTEE